jgi:hypothetical protein
MEYNSRVMQFGLRAMPSSFNGLEAFLTYLPPLIGFRLGDEQDHEFSWTHFVDWITASTTELQLQETFEDMPSDLILNYSNSESAGALPFASPSGPAFGPKAFSMIRHGSEVTVAFTGGQTVDWEKVTKEIRRSNKSKSTSYKPYLEPIDTPTEPVELAGTPGFWRTIAAVRYDLEDHTQEARYVLRDVGNSYIVITDDFSVLMDERGEFLAEELHKVAEQSTRELATYSALFELCSIALHLPAYFRAHEDEVRIERRETDFRKQFSTRENSDLKKLVPPSTRLAYRSVSVVSAPAAPLPIPTREILGAEFKVETTGFWKRLDPDVKGADKHGNEILGKTWVTKRLVWLETDPTSSIKSREPALPEGPDPGWLYVMRSAAHPPSVFKVGLTRRETNTRARELSRTGSPDHLLVVTEWPVSDCATVERAIHDELAPFRVTPAREFFDIPLQDLVGVVNRVIDRHQTSTKTE